MSTRHGIAIFCLAAVITLPFHSSRGQNLRFAHCDPYATTGYTTCLDLCRLADQLSSEKAAKQAVTEIAVEDASGNLGHWMAMENHAEIRLSVRNHDQVQFSCSKNGYRFQIFGIALAQRRGSSRPNHRAPGSPFDNSNGRNQIPTGQVASISLGPAISAAAGHTYKYSFRVFDPSGQVVQEIDPHLYVDK